MPTIADANQLLSGINPSSSPTPNNLHSNQLAAAELPITSSGVRIASPTSRPSKHPPPTVPKHHLHHHLHLRQNQSLIENPNQSQNSQNNHQQSQSSSILLPTRAQPQVQVYSRRGVASRSGSSSFWQSLFSSCIAVETERTIACTDRVIYRPTADDEDQQVVTPPPPPPPQPPNSSIGGGSGGNRRNNRLNRRRRSSSSSSQTIMACCSGRNGNGGPYQKCLKRLALAILLLLLAAVLLEVVHVLTNTCKYSFLGEFYLSTKKVGLTFFFGQLPRRPVIVAHSSDSLVWGRPWRWSQVLLITLITLSRLLLLLLLSLKHALLH